MAKITWPGATLLSPVPAVLVTSGTVEKPNAATVAWTGIVNSEPPMTYISLRKSRHSHKLISETGEFVINLTTASLARATDACGVYTGAKMNKFKAYSLTAEPAAKVSAPLLAQSPLSLECRVTEIKPLGSHDMFLAEIVAVDVEEGLLDENGKLDLRRTNLMAYSHGDYIQLGKKVGQFGWSVKKKKKNG
ncbi:MAG: flavin reductase family protein [Clostridia bacterium]|nr:flavin reductase family protein [Clostridia bacterium]